MHQLLFIGNYFFNDREKIFDDRELFSSMKTVNLRETFKAVYATAYTRSTHQITEEVKSSLQLTPAETTHAIICSASQFNRANNRPCRRPFCNPRRQQYAIGNQA